MHKEWSNSRKREFVSKIIGRYLFVAAVFTVDPLCAFVFLWFIDLLFVVQGSFRIHILTLQSEFGFFMAISVYILININVIYNCE